MKQTQKDELLTRRQFFKSAASTMVPIAAVIAMPGILTSCDPDDEPSGGGGGS